jgi:hypothetical protein
MGREEPASGRPTRTRLPWLALSLAVTSLAYLAGSVFAADRDGPPARAAAGDALTLTGVVIDKTGMVDSANWTVSESSARWDTSSFTGDYSWTIPSSIPSAGAQASLRVIATDKSGGRYNGVISAAGDIPVEDGPAQAQALADKNGGQATASASKSFKLVPGSYCDTCRPSFTVSVQDGPRVIFQYKVAAPPPPPACTTASFAFTAAKCQIGYGGAATVVAPPGRPINVSPQPDVPRRATALEVFLALQELQNEEEAEQLAAAILLPIKDEQTKQQFLGCMLLSDLLGDPQDDELSDQFARQIAALAACKKLVLDRPVSTNRPVGAGRVAANGCNAVFIPVFGKRRKVTKRLVRRAKAAARRQVAASCTDRPGKLSISLRARGGRKLRAITGRKARGVVARRLRNGSPKGANREMSVRWRARKG